MQGLKINPGFGQLLCWVADSDLTVSRLDLKKNKNKKIQKCCLKGAVL